MKTYPDLRLTSAARNEECERGRHINNLGAPTQLVSERLARIKGVSDRRVV